MSRPVPRWLLRRADQLGVAALTTLALVVMLGWWIAQGGLTGRTIDIDSAERQSFAFQVNINEADWPELAQLPGIGETLAKRIVDTRQTAGPFHDHDDLRRVRGIGPKTLERLRPYLLPLADTETVAAR